MSLLENLCQEKNRLERPYNQLDKKSFVLWRCKSLQIQSWYNDTVIAGALRFNASLGMRNFDKEQTNDSKPLPKW